MAKTTAKATRLLFTPKLISFAEERALFFPFIPNIVFQSANQKFLNFRRKDSLHEQVE